MGGALIFEKEGRIRTPEGYSFGNGPILAWPPTQQIVVQPS
jgi:hypothetical protein